MTFEEIKTIVTAVVASLGGITGIVAIINGIVRIITAAKTAKATKANTSALGTVKDELMGEIENRMNCALDVDISAKLNPVLEAIEAKYLNTAKVLTEQVYALKELNTEIAQMMSTSRKLSEEERLHVLTVIKQCNELITLPEEENKPKLHIALTEPEAQAVETKEKSARRVTV